MANRDYEKSRLIEGQKKDIGGGLMINRILPRPHVRSLGTFVFLDFIGPVQLSPQTVMDVRPHPHIGLATVTYFFSGGGLHRDSLGHVAHIQPGDLAIMTSGRGIAHSERTPPGDRRENGPVLHGIQLWMALPKELEDTEPRFEHFSADHFPFHALSHNSGGAYAKLPADPQVLARVLAGELHSIASPVKTDTRALLVELRFRPRAAVELTIDAEEIGLLMISGRATVELKKEEGEVDLGRSSNLLEAERLWIVQRLGTKRIRVECSEDAHIMLLGGPRLQEPRHMWWNFVATDKDKIRVAADKWKKGLFAPVPGESESIPLPSDPI